MISQEGLDPSSILADLGITEIGAVTPVIGGQDTVIWRVEHGGQSSALRVFRADQFDPCRREVLALQASAEAGLPVPVVRAQCVWQERPAMLISWCPGQTLLESFQSRRSQIMRLATAYGRMQARTHTVCAPKELCCEEHAWLQMLGPSETVLHDRLRALPLRANALLHLDYHPQNVLCDQGDISGIIDWTNTFAGDPRADLARTLVTIRLAAAPPDIPPLAVSLLRCLLLHGWRRGYEQIAGPIGDMSLFYAWAGAAIWAEQVGKPDRPGLSAYLARLQKWTADWKRRASVF